jgi:hypothetical protein
MPVKVKGKVLGSTKLDVISLTAGPRATMSADATTITGSVTMTVEGGRVEVNGTTVVITGKSGGVEISAPEVKIKTPGGTVVVNASGVAIDGAVVKLNCG